MIDLNGWELVVLGMVAVVVVIPVATLLLLIPLLTGRRPAAAAPQASPPAALGPSVDAQLAEADRLLQYERITESEHEAMRARILGIG